MNYIYSKMNANESTGVSNQVNLGKYLNNYLDCLNRIERSCTSGHFLVECKQLDRQYLQKLKEKGYNTHYYTDNGRYELIVRW